MATTEREVIAMNQTFTKRVPVSSKKQVTIPRQIVEALQIENEVEFVLTGGKLQLRRPIESDDFSDLILKDLIEQGVPMERLHDEFMRYKTGIRSAVKQMIAGAQESLKDFDPAEAEREHNEIFADVLDTEDSK
jgi:bifunctional DNA-binding transcriptional regulator/antitoxin component of YhaV-PrlF toxin-antitoxin module